MPAAAAAAAAAAAVVSDAVTDRVSLRRKLIQAERELVSLQKDTVYWAGLRQQVAEDGDFFNQASGFQKLVEGLQERLSMVTIPDEDALGAAGNKMEAENPALPSEQQLYAFEEKMKLVQKIIEPMLDNCISLTNDSSMERTGVMDDAYIYNHADSTIKRKHSQGVLRMACIDRSLNYKSLDSMDALIRKLRAYVNKGAKQALEKSWGLILSVFDNLLKEVNEIFEPKVLIPALFKRLFYFINMQLFNQLLLRIACCSFSNGECIQSVLTAVDNWIQAAGPEFVADSWEELKHIRQAVKFLVIPNKPEKSLKEITDLCPVLSIQQLYRISTIYLDDRYNTETVSAQVLASMKLQMVDGNSSSFFLDDDSQVPFDLPKVPGAMDDNDWDASVQVARFRKVKQLQELVRVQMRYLQDEVNVQLAQEELRQAKIVDEDADRKAQRGVEQKATTQDALDAAAIKVEAKEQSKAQSKQQSKQELYAFVEKILSVMCNNAKNEITPMLDSCLHKPKDTFMICEGGQHVPAAQLDLNKPWDELLAAFEALLEILKESFLPKELIQDLFKQLFSFVNVQLFNRLLPCPECCSLSNGKYAKAGLEQVDKWIQAAGTDFVSDSWDELKNIRQAVNFLVTDNKSEKSLEDITTVLCPVLTIQQLYCISTMYWDDTSDGETVSAEVLACMKEKMQDSNNAGSLPILLYDKPTLPFATSNILGAMDDKVEAKYPALLFRQRVDAFLHKEVPKMCNNAKKTLTPLLASCANMPKGTARGLGGGHNEPAAQQALKKSWGKIKVVFDSLLEELKEGGGVPKVLIQNLFKQLFSFVNVQLFNQLLSHPECCSFSNAAYIESGLAQVKIWIQAAGTDFVADSWDELKHIRQAVAFLVICNKPEMSLEEITKDLCPVLSIQQLYHISTVYKDPIHYTKTVSAEVLVCMKQKVDSFGPGPLNIFLCEDPVLPIGVPEVLRAVDDKGVDAADKLSGLQKQLLKDLVQVQVHQLHERLSPGIVPKGGNGRALHGNKVDATYPGMLFKRQLVAFVQKMITPILANRIQASKGTARELGDGQHEPAAKLGVSKPCHEIPELFECLLKELEEKDVPKEIIQDLFKQLFSCVNVQLFKLLLLRRECCSFSNGDYIRTALDYLEEWIQCNARWVSNGNRVPERISL